MCLQANGINGPFMSTLTTDNEARWRLYLNFLAALKVHNLPPPVTFVMELPTLEMCKVVNATCFYANNSLSHLKYDHTGSDDYQTNFWRTTVATGKPLALWLSSTLDLDFVFIETDVVVRGDVLKFFSGRDLDIGVTW